MKYSLGYTTGTFDLFHDGHVRLLKFMKSRCDVVLVGLTTDELGTKQKRKPMFSFNHRRSLLEGCKYVDLVVAHHGLSKEEDHTKLKFDVLCIGDDYYGKDEYQNFTATPVLYIPRTPSISTSILWPGSTTMSSTAVIPGKKDELSNISPVHSTSSSPIRALSILACGLHGPVLKLGDTHLVKYLNVGKREAGGSTADVYNLPLPRPRNWKQVASTQKYPNIVGVNTNRELAIHQYIKDQPWNPVLEVSLAWVKPDNRGVKRKRGEEKEGKEGKEGKEAWKDEWDTITSMQEERRNPQEIHSMTQRFAGQTLKSWWCTAAVEERKEAYKKVLDILHILQEKGVVHNDVHACNICVDNNNNVSLIDFGWCMHGSFDMTTEETDIYLERLDKGFDLQHFKDSMIWDDMTIDLETTL